MVLAQNSVESLKQIAKNYTERLWNAKDLAAVDTFLHPNVIINSLLGTRSGRKEMKEFARVWLRAFPDLNIHPIAIICENDLVAFHWEVAGTHQGEFQGYQPTGRRGKFRGVFLYRIADGRITEYWGYLDMLALIKQLS